MIERGERPDVATALAIIRANAIPIASERVRADAAGLRVVAANVVATVPVPRFRCSAMDGFAIDSATSAGSTPETVTSFAILPGLVAAGAAAPPLPSGSACAIATGAPVPAGADAVVIREHAFISREGRLHVGESVASGLNVRAQGEDVDVGETLLNRGDIVTPAMVGLFVSAGVDQVDVCRVPLVRVLSTGSELGTTDVEDPATIPDSNGPMLAAALREFGMGVEVTSSLPDDRLALAAAFRDADADVLISTGGVSVGERDLVPAALAELGATIHFNGVAMRPGKPVLFATLSDGRPFFGLPGNPVAALVGFRFFVTALLRSALGTGPEKGIAISQPVARRPGTTLFLRGRIRYSHAGLVGVELAGDQRSHILSSTAAADCWVAAGPDPSKPALLFPQRPSLDR